MILKEKNKIAREMGFSSFEQLKVRLEADGQFRQLVTGDDIINSVRFLKTIDKCCVISVIAK